jgi:PEP-CTERM motif
MKKKLPLAAATALLALAGTAQAGLVNGSFETLLVPMPAANYVITNQSNVPGWQTSATDGNIEIWQQPGPDPTTTPADMGIRYAELNATQTSTLYQDISGIAAGDVVGWQLSHRGRFGTDTMNLSITDFGADNLFGTADDVLLLSRNLTDDNTAWGHYSGTGLVALGNRVRFAFAAISSTGPDNTYGNFLDAADFGVGVGAPVPEPASVLLAATALLAAGAARRRRRA